MFTASSESTQVGRAVLYRFLALAFHEPRETLIKMLSDPEQLAQLRAAAEELDQVGEARAVYPALQSLLESCPPEGWLLPEMRVEYTRLFIGPGGMPCPPYESIFDHSRPKEEHGTVEGPTADAMRDALAAEGLVIELDHNELADHIAIEIEYMYYLLSKALADEETLENEYLSRANQFLDQHLSRWLPDFGKLVAESSNHPFYQNLGDLLSAIVKLDAELFGINDSHQEDLPSSKD